MIRRYSCLYFLFVLSLLNSCSVEHRDALTFDDLQDTWGEVIELEPEFYAAEDVSQETIALTKKYYKIASEHWGNYGPMEFWMVGKST